MLITKATAADDSADADEPNMHRWTLMPDRKPCRAYFSNVKSKQQKQIATVMLNDRGSIIVAVDESKQLKAGWWFGCVYF